MSKCDVRIEFSRPDRTYVGGETVSGQVHVSVNNDTNSRGVVLEQCWRTHGRGNTASGDKAEIQLYAGPLQAGEALDLPFSITAPPGPPTYHGHHLNIDHYLKARVDVPWAFDPKCEEDFLLAPGNESYGQRPTAQGNFGKQGCQKFGAVAGVGMLLVGILFVFPFGLVLIPAGLLVLFFAMRKKFAERRLGKVECQFATEMATPGGTIPLTVSFTPPKAIRLGGIHFSITAQEQCTSGSGTNTTTHTHQIYSDRLTVAGAQQLPPNQPQRFETTIELPDIAAYSFEASDNKLNWIAEVKIQLPLWPDWVEKREILVRPVSAEAYAPTSQVSTAQVAGEPHVTAGQQPGERMPDHAPSDPEQIHSPAEATFANLDAGIRPTVDLPEPVPQVVPAAEMTLPLVTMLDAIAAESRYSQGRERLVEEHQGETFTCPLSVRRTERTYVYDASAPYRDGRTIYGILESSQHEVTIQMKASRNEDIDRLRSGDGYRCEATPVKWNSIYDRLEMRET